MRNISQAITKLNAVNLTRNFKYEKTFRDIGSGFVVVQWSFS